MKYCFAVLYQANLPPTVDGAIKPMKDGGYADSGADIAFALQQKAVNVITPEDNPNLINDLDWVFPDTDMGIRSAIARGANVVWLNTVLYKEHPISYFIDKGIAIVGQRPGPAGFYDDKLVTNELLSKHELPIPRSITITSENRNSFELDFPLPVVVKPIRGRGSQGVSLAKDTTQLHATIKYFFEERRYGNALYIEEFLSGEELTITIMPPGVYQIGNAEITKNTYWSLPPVKRFNHNNGIAPYNGTVAVIHNSKVLDDDELSRPAIKQLCEFCEQAAMLVGAKASIRIDCRADAEGRYYLFDLNMKPNMTGASRPHRAEQDSLSALAARKIGWSYEDLIFNMFNQRWISAD